MSQGVKMRKALSKKTRFEIFKRDKFTCQYCGRISPDVILNVDHIKPVSKGGDSDFLNLITACKECNSGKSNRLLSENDAVKKHHKRMKELSEKKEQVSMMFDWMKELSAMDDLIISKVASHWDKLVPGATIADAGRVTIKNLIKRFSLPLIFESIEISVGNYVLMDNGKVDLHSASYAFSKIGGICYNKLKGVK